MGKLWMNITSSMSWNGNAVGIIRVERELAKFIEHEACFVDINGFRSVRDKADYTGNTPRLSVPKKEPKLHNKATYFTLSASSLSRRRRLVRSIGYLISSLYGKKQNWNRFINFFVFHSYRFISRWNLLKPLDTGLIVQNKEASRKRKEENSRKFHSPFSNGDLLFTCGLDWDHSILEKLQVVKKEIDLKVITVVYDLIPVVHPEYIQNVRHSNRLLGHFSLLVEISDLVLVNTDYTRSLLVDFCHKIGVRTPKIEVVPWGVSIDQHLNAIEVVEIQPTLDSGGFFLSVGTFEIRKNYQLLLNIVRMARAESLALPVFVFVGVPGWGTSDMQNEIRNDEGLRDHIVWLQTTTDEQLKWLYQNCRAFLSPTFDEGYGLPVAEAQSFGKPLFLSDIPVYRELFPSASFFSPHDPRAWIRALNASLPLSGTQKNHHSWQKVAKMVEEKIRNMS